MLYRETACSSTRLELFEGSGPPAPEKLKKGESSKKLIKLSDCVHVVEANSDASSPKETTPFLVETTEKCYLLAAESMEVADWINKLCELAFPVRLVERGGLGWRVGCQGLGDRGMQRARDWSGGAGSGALGRLGCQGSGMEEPKAARGSLAG